MGNNCMCKYYNYTNHKIVNWVFQGPQISVPKSKIMETKQDLSINICLF